jgi:hypothetical protein
VAQIYPRSKSKSHYDRQSVGQSASLGVRRPSGTRDQFYFLLEIFFRQLQVYSFVAPSLTRGPVECTVFIMLRRTQQKSHFLSIVLTAPVLLRLCVTIFFNPSVFANCTGRLLKPTRLRHLPLYVLKQRIR